MAKNPQVNSRLIFTRAPWDAIDSSFEKLIPFDNPNGLVNHLAADVSSGKSRLYHLDVDGARVGLAVVFIEGAELIVQAVYCAAASPMTGEINAGIAAVARAENCRSIRFHTARAALAQAAVKNHGFRVSEIVLRKTL